MKILNINNINDITKKIINEMEGVKYKIEINPLGVVIISLEKSGYKQFQMISPTELSYMTEDHIIYILKQMIKRLNYNMEVCCNE